MSTLWIFGCSYSAEYTHRGNITNLYQRYKDYRNGILPDVWGKILSNKLNYEYVNCADGGVGNDFIFEQVCKNSENFKKDDILIVEWSYVERFRWILNDEWAHVSASSTPPFINEEFSNEILKMRIHPLFIETIFEYEKIIEVLSRAIGSNVFFWMGDPILQLHIPKNEKLDRKYIASKYIRDDDGTLFQEILGRRNGLRIFEETDGVINDNHFGEDAHKIMAELFYEHIKENI